MRRARSGSRRLATAASCPGDPSTQISALPAEVTDDLPVWHDLSKRYRCDAFCGLFMGGLNEGEDLEPRTLAMPAIGARRSDWIYTIPEADLTSATGRQQRLAQP